MPPSMVSLWRPLWLEMFLETTASSSCISSADARFKFLVNTSKIDLLSPFKSGINTRTAFS
jgi:hypothetical protein